LTAAARGGGGICGPDERMLAARVEQKNETTKDDKKWRDAPLTKKAPYKPDAGKRHNWMLETDSAILFHARQ
jgi:hypothetical protein